MKQWRRTRRPSHSSRAGLLANQISVFIHAHARLACLRQHRWNASDPAGISSAGDRHRLTSASRAVIAIINVTGRR
jgi:hypothetical protein